MHQAKVLEADEKLRHLANSIGNLPRGAVPGQGFIPQVVST